MSASTSCGSSGSSRCESPTDNASGLHRSIQKSIKLLKQEMSKEMQLKGTSVPGSVLQSAHGLLFVFMARVGICASGLAGEAVLICRDSQTGHWGLPIRLNLKGIGGGIDICVSRLSQIIVLRDQAAVAALLQSNSCSVGALIGESVAGETLGKADVSATNMEVVYSYVTGFSAGAGIHAVYSTPAQESNAKYYGLSRELADAHALVVGEALRHVTPSEAIRELHHALGQAEKRLADHTPLLRAVHV